jgi:hypothetical protein
MRIDSRSLVVGLVLCGLLVGTLSQHFGWSPKLVVSGLVCVGLAAGVVLWVRPVRARQALALTALPPLGVVLGFVFC